MLCSIGHNVATMIYGERWWAAEENVWQLTSVGKLHLNITNAALWMTSGRGHTVLDLCCMLLVYFMVSYLMITLCIPPKQTAWIALFLYFYLTKYPNKNDSSIIFPTMLDFLMGSWHNSAAHALTNFPLFSNGFFHTILCISPKWFRKVLLKCKFIFNNIWNYTYRESPDQER